MESIKINLSKKDKELLRKHGFKEEAGWDGQFVTKRTQKYVLDILKKVYRLEQANNNENVL